MGILTIAFSVLFKSFLDFHIKSILSSFGCKDLFASIHIRSNICAVFHFSHFLLTCNTSQDRKLTAICKRIGSDGGILLAANSIGLIRAPIFNFYSVLASKTGGNFNLTAAWVKIWILWSLWNLWTLFYFLRTTNLVRTL